MKQNSPIDLSLSLSLSLSLKKNKKKTTPKQNKKKQNKTKQKKQKTKQNKNKQKIHTKNKKKKELNIFFKTVKKENEKPTKKRHYNVLKSPEYETHGDEQEDVDFASAWLTCVTQAMHATRSRTLEPCTPTDVCTQTPHNFTGATACVTYPTLHNPAQHTGVFHPADTAQPHGSYSVCDVPDTTQPGPAHRSLPPSRHCTTSRELQRV